MEERAVLVFYIYCFYPFSFIAVYDAVGIRGKHLVSEG